MTHDDHHFSGACEFDAVSGLPEEIAIEPDEPLFFEGTPEQLHALRRACCHYAGSTARWAELAATGADDETLIAMLNKEFGLGGGSGGPGWLQEEHKAGPPRVWIECRKLRNYGITEKLRRNADALRGAELLRWVRRLFGISQPAPEGQLPLFHL